MVLNTCVHFTTKVVIVVFTEFVSAITMLENHCTRTMQSSRGGCSQQVPKIVCLAVDKGNILVNFFLLLKIFIVNYYHLSIQLCICLTKFLWVE